MAYRFAVECFTEKSCALRSRTITATEKITSENTSAISAGYDRHTDAAEAAAGVGAGAELHMYPGGSIQDAIDDAGEGIRFMCMPGRMLGNVDVDKRLTRKIYEEPDHSST